MPSKITPYAYVIIHAGTGAFYIGSRGANVRLGLSPGEDFWINYRSSSPAVKKMITDAGDEAIISEIVFTGEDAYWHEQALIQEHRKNPLCLNKHFVDRATARRGFSTAGEPKSREHCRKISAATKGVPKNPVSIARSAASQRGKTLSSEHRQKLAVSSTGRMHTEVARKKISAAKMGVPRSPETVMKMSAARKGVARTWVSPGTTGLKWYNDGMRNYQIKPEDVRATALNRGRL